MTALYDFLTDPATGLVCLSYGALAAWAYYPAWRRRMRQRRLTNNGRGSRSRND